MAEYYKLKCYIVSHEQDWVRADIIIDYKQLQNLDNINDPIFYLVRNPKNTVLSLASWQPHNFTKQFFSWLNIGSYSNIYEMATKIWLTYHRMLYKTYPVIRCEDLPKYNDYKQKSYMSAANLHAYIGHELFEELYEASLDLGYNIWT
jgi:hypothetical protein